MKRNVDHKAESQTNQFATINPPRISSYFKQPSAKLSVAHNTMIPPNYEECSDSALKPYNSKFN